MTVSGRMMGGNVLRVLVVNCYLDETRRLTGRPHFVPQAVGPVYIAGLFEPRHCELRLYSELYSGPLCDEAVFGWPDLVILTGMTTAYDRMLHIAAYVRTKNPSAVIVAGGPAIRALPGYSKQFFDYACVGDLEDIAAIVREAFGARFIAERPVPRYDLMSWMRFVGYVESSRNCNFKCSFCTMTAEGNTYSTYDLDDIRRQIERVGYRTCILFIDQNFYGNDRSFFEAKLALLTELYRKKAFGGWAALVTSDFFAKPNNLALAKQSGCVALFSGVESFERDQLVAFQKRQNLRIPQVELIRSCLEAGIVFQYGVIFDTQRRMVDDFHREIEMITGTPEITLPAFMNLAIPILKTPYFYEVLAAGTLLPHTKLRDMDGNTVIMRPRDPVDRVVEFLTALPTLRGYKRRVARHVARFYQRYRRTLTVPQMVSCVGNGALLCLPSLAHNHRGWLSSGARPAAPRTYVTTTEPPGPLYQPLFPVAARYRHHFAPTMVTDGNGRLHEALVHDLTAAPSSRLVALHGPRVEP